MIIFVILNMNKNFSIIIIYNFLVDQYSSDTINVLKIIDLKLLNLEIQDIRIKIIIFLL